MQYLSQSNSEISNMSIIDDQFEEGRPRQYAKGQIVLYQGEETTSVFKIVSGYVEVYDVTAHGNEKLLLILGAGDIFPLLWTFGGNERLHYFYETIDDTEIEVMLREDFIRTVEESHEESLTMLRYFVETSRQLMSRIECIDSTSARHKIAQVLNYLAEAQGENKQGEVYRIKIPITHQAIADMAGVTRETASLQLKALEKKKMFENKDAYLLVHRDKIVEFLENGLR